MTLSNGTTPESIPSAPEALLGLHHITAIASDPQQALDFYTRVIGLRLVKLTVNFDDPETYHFYFGNGTGQPGTILTFFPIAGAPHGRPGNGQATALAFSISPAALDFWRARLSAHGLMPVDQPDRFGDPVIRFTDPDGLAIELIGTESAPEALAWAAEDIPLAMAVRGFHSVTLQVSRPEATETFLTRTLGFHQTQQTEDRTRFVVGAGAPGTIVDVLSVPRDWLGHMAAGSIHHIAWRVADDAAQGHWHSLLARLGQQVTPVVDRQYFHSIYFREPGHVLFEIATDPPGFTIDEVPEALGTHLQLPAQYEPIREDLEHVLPALTMPV